MYLPSIVYQRVFLINCKRKSLILGLVKVHVFLVESITETDIKSQINWEKFKIYQYNCIIDIYKYSISGAMEDQNNAYRRC